MNTIQTFKRLMSPIIARVRRVILGANIKSTNDSTPLQQMQVQSLGRALYDKVEVFGQFGFTSRAPDGLDAIIAERNGKYIVIAVGDRQFRIRNLESGDSVVYDMRGQTIVLNKSGITITDVFNNVITMNSAGVKIDDKNSNHIVMNASGNTITDAFGNSISTAAGGITINGVLITQAGVVTMPATLTTSGALDAGGAITAGGDITSGSGKTLDTHVHTFPYNAGSTPASGTTNPPTA